MPAKLRKKTKTVKLAATTMKASSPSPNVRNKIDWSDINNSFYKQHFVLKNDTYTDRYNEVMQTEYYIQHLPITFIEGLANFQEKKPLPLKRTPLFSKLIKGDYEDGRAKYDRTTVRVNVEFFVNNLPSFEKYYDSDKLDWVVKEHRKLAIEIFEYYRDKKRRSLSTLEYRFNAILRIIRIAYGNKITPLYKTFAAIVHLLNYSVLNREGKNKLNSNEEKKYIHWLDVLYIQSHMEKTFAAMKNKHTSAAYDYNNDLLLLSIYTLMPSLRNEVKFLEFSSTMHNHKKDYIYISDDKETVVFKFNKRKKMHDGVTFDISTGKYKNKHLANIIVESFELYPRTHLFTLKNKYPDVSEVASKRALDARLISIFFKHGITNQITVNSLRSSFTTFKLCDRNTSYDEKEELAWQMRTSVLCLDRSYKKILDKKPLLAEKNKTELIAKKMHTIEEETMSESSDSPDTQKSPNQYEKKLQRGREYYQKNKDRLNEYQREYNQKKKTPFEKTRERLLQLLNASEDYAQRMRASTKAKYKFVYDKDIGRWKWEA